MSSLRARVLLLACLTLFLLLVTLGILVAVLRNTQTAMVSSANRHLVSLASALANRYQNRTDRNLSLSNIVDAPIPGPPPGPPPPALNDVGKAPPPPPAPAAPISEALSVKELNDTLPSDPLAGITAAALQSESGIEGGFYDVVSNHLGGYAFPTHEGPAPKRDIPGRERPTILDLAKRAVTSGKTQTTRSIGPHDVVLFAAVPVCESASCSPHFAGSVWLMERLPGAEADRRRDVLWSAFAFGSMALILVAFAAVILSQVDKSVGVVLRRFSATENSLESHPEENALPRIGEFERILHAFDRLTSRLRTRIETEREMEARIRHSERLAALGQFAAGIAHELRNPLATIRLRVQMLQGLRADAVDTKHGSVALEEIDRLDAMIDRLLTFARPIQLKKTAVDVSKLCHSVAQHWEALYQQDGIAVLVRAEDGITCFVEEPRIRQVMDNLLQNAVEMLLQDGSASRPGSLEVECTRIQGSVMVRVSDHGPGFSSQALVHALDPFFTTRPGGTGLGLSLAYEIVQAHGGELSVANRPDGGAAVSFTLPCEWDGEKEVLRGSDSSH